MTIVIVERTFAEPVSFEDIEGVHSQLQWCLDVNGGKPLIHGIDSRRLRSLCLYEAPDVEAIRRVAEQAAAVPEPKIWPVSVHGPWQDTSAIPELKEGENTFALLDRVFERPVSLEDFGEEEVAHNTCLPIYGVRFLATFFSHDRSRMVCLYATPDLEAVRGVNRTAKYPFTEILPARPHRAETRAAAPAKPA